MKTLILSIAFVAACASPTGPRSPEGSWRLVAVDGAALPAQLSGPVSAVSGLLELNADGTYRERTNADAAGALMPIEIEGRWRWSGSTVELLDRVAGLPFVAQWTGATLEVHADHLMRYAR